MRTTILSICTVATTCVSACAIDFTPYLIQNVQGVQRAYFLDKADRYAVNLPRNTTVMGGLAKADFFFMALEGASFSIGVSPVAAHVPFSEPNLDRYRKAALAQADPSTVKATITKENPNPLVCNGWVSYGFTVAFEFPGRRIFQRVTFLNITPKEQWILVTTATERCFEEADARAMTMFASWRKLDSRVDLWAPVYP